MLEVTRADTGDRFAMKAIRKHGSPSGSANAKVVQQAQLERRILSRISHPFIIDLHCAFQVRPPRIAPHLPVSRHISHPLIIHLHCASQTHDKLLLVLEICPGGDLKAHVSRCGRFPPEVAAFCAAQAYAPAVATKPTVVRSPRPSPLP